MRIVFMGTPDFSVPVLDAILDAGHSVVAVYSQPPRPAGRGMTETKSPVHRRAEERGIHVSTPVNFKAEADRVAFAALRADAAVVVAYGLMLPEAVLAATRLGCFNVHASKLPRWRGAAPIQRAIMAGDEETAVMIMRMEKGLDTGPVCLAKDIEIGPEMTAGELHDRLSEAGAAAIVEALQLLEAGTLLATPQADTGVTYAAKIGKSETHIDFTKSADEVVNHIRGLSPFPGAWFSIAGPHGDERVKVLRAVPEAGSGAPGTVLDGDLTIACGEGAVRLKELQRAGKKAVLAPEFLRGFKLERGTRVT
jgi:methionyl-tRNA formyltransferase